MPVNQTEPAGSPAPRRSDEMIWTTEAKAVLRREVDEMKRHVEGLAETQAKHWHLNRLVEESYVRDAAAAVRRGRCGVLHDQLLSIGSAACGAGVTGIATVMPHAPIHRGWMLFFIAVLAIGLVLVASQFADRR